MNDLPSQVARKTLQRDLTNLAQRVQGGGTLSRAERCLLQRMATAQAEVEAGPAFASSFVELAAILGVTRRSLQRWRARGDAPKPGSDGLHEVGAWREFMRQARLAGHCGEEEAALRLRRLQAQTEEREMRLAELRAAHVSVANVRAEWERLTARATRVLRHKFEVELPPLLVGRSAAEIQTLNMRAIDEALDTLHRGG
jgi:hypothetical protein